MNYNKITDNKANQIPRVEQGMVKTPPGTMINDVVYDKIPENITEPNQQPDEEIRAMVYNCEQLYFRSKPNKEADVLKVLNKGDILTIVQIQNVDEDHDDWAHVQHDDGTIGYVMGEFIRGGITMDSILTSIKKLLGPSEEDTSFDNDIIMAINSVLMAVNQFGIGPVGFLIADKTAKWTDLLGDRKDLEGVKSYIYLKVRLMFDPPSNSFLIESINNQIQELEWRLISQVESTMVIPTVPVIEE